MHLNHTRRQRKAVLFHRYVLRGWEKGESNAAKGRDLPSSRIHLLCLLLLFSFFLLLARPSESERAFSPARVNTENTRKIHTQAREERRRFFERQSRRCCHRRRRRRNDPLIKQRCMQMACREETGSIKTVTIARV